MFFFCVCCPGWLLNPVYSFGSLGDCSLMYRKTRTKSLTLTKAIQSPKAALVLRGLGVGQRLNVSAVGGDTQGLGGPGPGGALGALQSHGEGTLPSARRRQQLLQHLCG